MLIDPYTPSDSAPPLVCVASTLLLLLLCPTVPPERGGSDRERQGAEDGGACVGGIPGRGRYVCFFWRGLHMFLLFLGARGVVPRLLARWLRNGLSVFLQTKESVHSSWF